MEKWTKAAVLLLCVILWSMITIYGLHTDVHDILGIKTVDQKEWADIQSSRMQAPFQGAVCFEGEALPRVNQLDGYLITQSTDTLQWQGSLSIEEPYEMCFLRSQMNKTELVHTGSALELMIYNDDTYDVVHIVASGMPVLYLTKEPEVGQLAGTGRLLVLENQALGRKNIIEGTTYICKYRNRGGTSALSPKRPWKLNLLDAHGRKRNEPLLGMKNDNDWIMNPLYSDMSNMRERIGYDIWAMMGGENQHQSEYCEFVLEGDYQGIFLLSECVDYSTYGLNGQNSYLCSVKDWCNEENKAGLYASDAEKRYYANENKAGEFSIDKFPEGELDTAIELLRALHAIVSGESYSSAYSIAFDQENMLLHALLIDLIQGQDNRYKNQKFAIKKESENQYTVIKTPWDLDITMQNETYPEWAGTIERHVQERFLPADVDQDWMKQKLSELYWKFRDEFFNDEALGERIDGYYEYLEMTGAAKREMRRWDEPDFRQSCDYLKKFFSDRIKALDAYYGG